jgi:hypothetical protein
MSATTAFPELEPAVAPHPAPTPAELHRQFQQAAAFANRNTYRLLVLIRQMDACAGYEAYGCSTLAHYLELVCGITRIAARERIRVASALEHLPAIARAFEAGELSYSKVRAVSRVATAESDGDWLAALRSHTAEELETMAARSTPDEEGRRRLFTRPVNRLVTRMVVELPADEMELLNRALDRIREEAGGKLAMSEALVFLAADSLAGDPGTVSTADRYTVVIHAGEDGTAWAETAAGPAPLKPAVVERLLCDTTIRLAREEEDGTFSLSRRQRTIPIVTRRAIEIRDGRRCRVPGCKHRLWLDIHHLEEYAKGGRHDRENLMLLCRYHHRMYHEKRLRIERDAKGGLRFITANGWVIGDSTAVDEETFRLWEEQLAMCAFDAEWEAMRAAVTADDAPHWDPEERAFGASFAGEDTKRFRGIVVGANFVSTSNDSAESPAGNRPDLRVESGRWRSLRKQSITWPGSPDSSSPPRSGPSSSASSETSSITWRSSASST